MTKPKTPDQDRASRKMHFIGESTMGIVKDACFEADGKGMEFLGFVMVAAIKGEELVGSTIFYDQRSDRADVATLLRMTAANLLGENPDVAIVEHGRIDD